MPGWIIVIFTLIAVILLLFTITRIAKVLFKKGAEGKVISLFNGITDEGTKAVIHKDDLKDLPYPVQNWLTNSNIIGRERIKTVRLKQEGKMRTKINGPWMPTKAEQYFTVEEPGFVWIADVKMAPFVHLSGIDIFNTGKGKMNIKVLSLFSVVDSEGPEMDSSTMMRYLAEMMWFPTAALSPYIKWEEIDMCTAKVIMEHEGISVSGIFYFNEKGDILRFVGKRYKEVNGKYILSDWGGVNKEFKEFDGIRIPSKSDVTWFEEDGEFNWFKLEITELQYNEPTLY
jgi:hypothetical protein